jgi:hypothetical protein
MRTFLKLAEGLWRGPRNKRFRQVLDVRIGQASPAPIIEIRHDGENGSVLHTYDDDRQLIRAYASSSPEIEKLNYVKWVCQDLNILPTTILKTLL